MWLNRLCLATALAASWPLLSLTPLRAGELSREEIAGPDIQDRDVQGTPNPLPDQAVRKEPSERTPEESLRYAHWLLEFSPEKALKEYDAFLGRPENGDLALAAHFGRGKALRSLGRLLEAFEEMEQSFPPMPNTQEIEARCAIEMEIGKQWLALGAKPVSPGGSDPEKNESGYQAASRVFQAVVYNDPQGALAPEAILGLGDAELGLSHFERAENTYLRLVRDYARSPWSDVARVRAARSMALRHPKEGMQSSLLLGAEELLSAVGATPWAYAPAAAEVEETRKLLNEGRADEDLARAEFYLKGPNERAKNAGAYLLRAIQERYAGTPAATKARERLRALEGPGTVERTQDHAQ
ncbi:MAG: hypothetical protein V1918_02215 [Planctomycetota bacterium]